MFLTEVKCVKLVIFEQEETNLQQKRRVLACKEHIPPDSNVVSSGGVETRY
jgi:hypothetical protein